MLRAYEESHDAADRPRLQERDGLYADVPPEQHTQANTLALYVAGEASLSLMQPNACEIGDYLNAGFDKYLACILKKLKVGAVVSIHAPRSLQSATELEGEVFGPLSGTVAMRAAEKLLFLSSQPITPMASGSRVQKRSLVQHTSMVASHSRQTLHETDVHAALHHLPSSLATRTVPKRAAVRFGAIQELITCSPVSQPRSDDSGITLAVDLEYEQKVRQVKALLAVCPPNIGATLLDFQLSEWTRLPEDRKESLLLKALTVFSIGTLAGARSVLRRLRTFLEVNQMWEACQDFKCSGGLLSLFVTDAQSTSRSKGDSIPHSLASSLGWCMRQLKLELRCDNLAFKNITAMPSRQPTAAKSFTVRILYHFLILSQSEHRVVAEYSQGICVTTLAALRLRDAQRAHLDFSEVEGGERGAHVSGKCYTSKHPSQRAAVPMNFYAPSKSVHVSLLAGYTNVLQQRDSRLDFVFSQPSFPRGTSIAHAKATLKLKPASTSQVIRQLRALLQLAPLSLSAEDAAEFSGHSPRHFLQTFMRIYPSQFTEAEREEVNRYASTVETKSRRGSMPNRYSQETEQHAVLPTLHKILHVMGDAVKSHGFDASGLPQIEDWSQLTESLPAEASSSESDSDDEGTIADSS